MNNTKIIFVIFIILAWIIPAKSLVIKSGTDVVIRADEVIDDDLIAMGRSVKIEGTVNGDVFAFAQEVTIENIVNGSIYTGCAQVNINTKNCRSLWAFCGSLNADGNIENNLLFFGGHLKTGNTNLIKKDIIAFGGEIKLNGEVQGKVKGNMGKFNLSGKIGGADIQADKVNIESGAMVMENLIIKGNKEPVIDPNAKILGKTEYKKIEAKTHKPKTGATGFFKTLFFISKLIIGIILIALFKLYIKKTNKILKDSTWKSLGFGFLTIIVIPVVSVITLATIIGIPIAIFGVFVFLTLAYVSGIVFATGFGEWVIKLIKKDTTISPILSFIVGFIIITLVCLIPYLGFFVRLAVLFFGTGMIVLLVHKLRRGAIIALEEK